MRQGARFELIVMMMMMMMMMMIMVTIIKVLDYLVLQIQISVLPHKLTSHCHSILPSLVLFLILI